LRLVDWRATRTARLVFWAAAVFAFVMAVVPQPPQLPGAPSDKVQHIAAFAMLAVLSSFAYPATKVTRLLASLSLFGALIEVVQAIPALHRDSDVVDWIADTVAVAVVLVIVSRLRRRRAQR
jgi:VanZ family protein